MHYVASNQPLTGHVRSSTFNSPTPALARASSGFFRRQRSSGNGSGGTCTLVLLCSFLSITFRDGVAV